MQFTYSTASRSYLAVLSVDGAGKASVYFPGGQEAARIEPGQEVSLRASTVLDDTLGRETVVALFCDEPVLLEPVRASFERSGSAKELPAGCRSDQISFTKKAKE